MELSPLAIDRQARGKFMNRPFDRIYHRQWFACGNQSRCWMRLAKRRW